MDTYDMKVYVVKEETEHTTTGINTCHCDRTDQWSRTQEKATEIVWTGEINIWSQHNYLY
jgi:hypothetical protein